MIIGLSPEREYGAGQRVAPSFTGKMTGSLRLGFENAGQSESRDSRPIIYACHSMATADKNRAIQLQTFRNPNLPIRQDLSFKTCLSLSLFNMNKLLCLRIK